MHELSLCQAICATVEERADGRPVRRVDVRIGYLRQVVPDSLQFAWEMLTEGTDLEGCLLVIEHVPAVVRCRACGVDTTLDWPVLACAACEGHDVELVTGEEFQIASFDHALMDDTALIDTALIDTALIDTALIDTALIDTAEGAS